MSDFSWESELSIVIVPVNESDRQRKFNQPHVTVDLSRVFLLSTDVNVSEKT